LKTEDFSKALKILLLAQAFQPVEAQAEACGDILQAFRVKGGSFCHSEPPQAAKNLALATIGRPFAFGSG
jgi:hypothetical protein